ncbi:hypothetical protein FRC06_009383, partial [Ceratobasidium sp. 370]
MAPQWPPQPVVNPVAHAAAGLCTDIASSAPEFARTRALSASNVPLALDLCLVVDSNLGYKSPLSACFPPPLTLDSLLPTGSTGLVAV